jgi:hypothetical protein
VIGREEAKPSARYILVLFCGLLAAACDPCFGTAACAGSLDVSATGQLIEFRSGEGVAGVELIFRRTGGIQLVEPEGRVTTDGDGLYSYRADAMESGSVTFSVTVRPPSLFPEYTVQGVTLATSAVKGEGQPLDRWLVNPYLAYVGEVRTLDTQEVVGPGGRVTFVRRSGIGIVPDSVETTLDPHGRFLVNPDPLGVGEVVADLTIRHPSLDGPRIINGLRVSTRHVDDPIDLTEVLYLP